MRAIRDLSLGRKLFGGFGLIVLLLICVGGAGLWSALAMRSDADAMSHATDLASDASRLETLAAGLAVDGSDDDATALRSRPAALDRGRLSAAQRSGVEKAASSLGDWSPATASREERLSGIAKVGERLIVLIDAAAMVGDLGIAEEAA